MWLRPSSKTAEAVYGLSAGNLKAVICWGLIELYILSGTRLTHGLQAIGNASHESRGVLTVMLEITCSFVAIA